MSRTSGVVASNADPRQLIIDLLSEEVVGAELIAKMRRYEWGDGYMTIYLALDAPVTYNAGPDAQRSPYVHATPPSLECLALIYAQCRSGLLPAAPFVLMCNNSVIDPSCVPAGKAVMKLIVHNVPYDIRGDATCPSQMSSGWRGTANRVMLSPDVGCLQIAVVAVPRVVPIARVT